MNYREFILVKDIIFQCIGVVTPPEDLVRQVTEEQGVPESLYNLAMAFLIKQKMIAFESRTCNHDDGRQNIVNGYVLTSRIPLYGPDHKS